jgi:NHL repeat
MVAVVGLMLFASTGSAAEEDPAFVRAFGSAVNSMNLSDICTGASGCRAGSNTASAAGLSYPRGVAVSGSGDVYVASGNNRIDVFNSSGTFLRAFGKGVNSTNASSNVCTEASGCKAGSGGAGAGDMFSPEDVAVSATGEVYVVDQTYRRIAEFNSAGTFVRAFGKGVNSSDSSNTCTTVSGCKSGSSGSAAGEFGSPAAIAVSGSEVYVADESNHRIAVYNASGTFVRAFGKGVGATGIDVCTTSCQAGSVGTGAGQLDAPQGVAVSSGEVYVAEQGNNRVSVFTTAGTFLRSFGSPGDGAGELSNPRGVAVTPGGRVFVADDNNRITQFSASGSFVRAFGSSVNSDDGSDVCTAASGCKAGTAGPAAGELDSLTGIAVSDAGEVFVTDQNNHRVDEFSVGEDEPEPEPEDGDDDGVPDTSDNCPLKPNPTQVNSDRDNKGGDACDADDDNDGLSEAAEQQRGTKRLDRDSDDDGLGDGTEVSVTKTKPAKFDTDGDKLSDGLERGLTKGVPDPSGAVVGTNPSKFKPDTDPKTKTKPRKKDTDGDGLSDGGEDKNHNGRRNTRETNPLKKDTDGDGFNDKADDKPLDESEH